MALAKEAINLIWKSPGPVSTAYKNSRAPVKAICGPVGGGKTTTSFHSLIDIALEQPIAPDGIAYVKFGVVRDTYRNLTRTTIPSWHKIVPASVGRWVGGGNGDPAFHEFEIQVGNRRIHMRMEFFALNGNSVEEVLRGWEGTALYLNEFDTLPVDALTFGRQRVGRYPDNSRGGCPRAQVIIDMNAPEPNSDAYRLFWKEKPKGFELFVQPGGRDAGAENIDNLPGKRAYYTSAVAGQPDWYVRRFIDNLPGFGRSGSLVLPEYNDRVHCSRGIIKPIEGLPILLAMDAGGHPALTCWQKSSIGQVRGIGELHAAHMGPNGFADEANAFLANKFGNDFEYRGVCDPSAFYGDYDAEEDPAFARTFGKKLGVKFEGARTNLVQPRLDAVRFNLLRMIDGVTPGFVISECMEDTRAAFNGEYIYEKKRTNSNQEKDEPEKLHPTSDLMDTVQYASLALNDFDQVQQRRVRSGGGDRRVAQAKTRFNVFG